MVSYNSLYTLNSRSLGFFFSIAQVIQPVTFLSPNVGGNQQPSKGSGFHHPKKGHKELASRNLFTIYIDLPRHPVIPPQKVF